jgi:hypothetical protein
MSMSDPSLLVRVRVGELLLPVKHFGGPLLL